MTQIGQDLDFRLQILLHLVLPNGLLFEHLECHQIIRLSLPSDVDPVFPEQSENSVGSARLEIKGKGLGGDLANLPQDNFFPISKSLRVHCFRDNCCTLCRDMAE